MIWKGVGAGSGVHDIPPLPRRSEAGIQLVVEELVRPPPLAARSPRCIPSAKSSSTETDFAIASGLASRTCVSHFSPSVSAATPLNDSVAPEARPLVRAQTPPPPSEALPHHVQREDTTAKRCGRDDRGGARALHRELDCSRRPGESGQYAGVSKGAAWRGK